MKTSKGKTPAGPPAVATGGPGGLPARPNPEQVAREILKQHQITLVKHSVQVVQGVEILKVVLAGVDLPDGRLIIHKPL